MNMEPIISYKEINMAISTFKNKKAPGMDNFKIEFVKELWRKIPDAICGLMNNCLNQGTFPKLWKVANLRILLKDESKDRILLSSYRPIALLSVIGKVLEKIIVNRVNELYKN